MIPDYIRVAQGKHVQTSVQEIATHHTCLGLELAADCLGVRLVGADSEALREAV